ncbi:MAG: type III effector [Gammaproteobacteria bacterium]|nr:MAG: type III effector [Gammaproteobacteria bacterium]
MIDIELLLNRIEHRPGDIEFPDVVALINRHYAFVPTAFRNGDLFNEAGQNNGACRLFAFARLHELGREQTLALFGAFYRADVLKNPDGDSHPNIRQFMKTGWEGIEFDGVPLRARSPRRGA